MVIIFSQSSEGSTNDVIDWFLYYNKKYLRYNGNDDFGKRKFTFKGEFSFSISNKIKIKNNNSIWLRRPSHKLDDVNIQLSDEVNIDLYNELNKSFKYNDKIFKEMFIEYAFNKKLGSYSVTGLNKPLILRLASELGLKIPETIVTNSKKKVTEFLYKYKSIINKALHESFSYNGFEEYWISNKTVEINLKSEIPTNFSVSLFQNKIEKMYEIRTFFLDNKIFSACIFSQSNEKTNLDFRNYDLDKPNRIVPYILPSNIEKKIIKLMKKINLNTGSIDLMRSINGEYVFLEINPVGQFGFISEPCNYHLELEVFKFLTNEK